MHARTAANAAQNAAPFVTCIINGMQQLVCPTPDSENTVHTASARAESHMNLRTPMYDLNTREQLLFQMNCMFLNNGDLEGPVRGRLILDGTPFDLGLIREAHTPVVANYLVGRYPREFVLEVRKAVTEEDFKPATVKSAEYPDVEKKLVDDVYDVLASDKYRGSLPSTFVQSLVMHSPVYTEVLMEKYRGKWHQFLAVHDDLFNVFKYSADEIRNYNFIHTCHANELRIALHSDRETMLSEDMRRERRRHHCEVAVFEFLHNLLLRHGECDSQFLMRELEANCPEYQDFMHPSFQMLERIVRQNEEGTFQIRDDPKRGAFISLKPWAEHPGNLPPQTYSSNEMGDENDDGTDDAN
eukprot:PhM_4_TR2821/c1_g1_i1/m.33146